MDTISAISAPQPLPSSIGPNQSAASSTGCANTPEAFKGSRDQIEWSPGMWWLLNRYEYLFEGLLPQNQAREVVIEANTTSSSETSNLDSAHPHWNESRLINPPPAAATLPAGSMEVPISRPLIVDQPVTGSFVDLIA